MIENQPFCLEESFYLKKLVGTLSPEIAEKSIFEHLRVQKNIPSFSDKYLSVLLLPHDKAQVLKLEEGAPSLFVEETYFFADGRPFDYSSTYYHPDYAHFYLQSNN